MYHVHELLKRHIVSVAASERAIFAGQSEPVIGSQNRDRASECGEPIDEDMLARGLKLAGSQPLPPRP